ncbi:MarR family winged helix-turn-helix transcriptional regulator [Agromyces sp. NPDC057865]|uniref:MarR family winged helix-turn-helix transcriptional regulator n=1 Tax=Agromyces sp. NPDC057865 TaxID=3346267 RepID=UPI00366D03EA
MGQIHTGVDLDASLGYLLKQAASTLRSSMDAALRPLGLTVPQYACLELLAQRPGLSNSELARGAFVTRQSMNVLLHGLERDGLVSRPVEPPTGGRAMPAQLTKLGRERLTVASSAAQAVEEQMHARLDADQQEALRALLTATITALNESPARQPTGIAEGSAAAP